jgi:S1-C subfamily serine protease
VNALAARLVSATFAFLILCTLPAACEAHPPFGRMQEVTGTLNLPDGAICSATVIGPHAIATATHCLKSAGSELRFRGIRYDVESIVSDGKDHSLVRVKGDLGRSAALGRPAKLGDDLWMIGNPMGVSQVLRRGLVIRRSSDETLLDCRCWAGDSGMGLFNEFGQLVGVFSGAYTERGPLGSVNFTLPVYFPFAFSREQWAEARR